jgi:hypothetical protein
MNNLKVIDESLSRKYKEDLAKVGQAMVDTIGISKLEANYLTAFYGAIKEADLFKSSYFKNFEYEGELIDFSNLQAFIKDPETFYDIVLYVFHSNELFAYYDLTVNEANNELVLVKKVLDQADAKPKVAAYTTPFDSYKVAEDNNYVTFKVDNYTLGAKLRNFFSTMWPNDKVIKECPAKFTTSWCIFSSGGSPSASDWFNGQKSNPNDTWYATFAKRNPADICREFFVSRQPEAEGNITDSRLITLLDQMSQEDFDSMVNQFGEVYLKSYNGKRTSNNIGYHCFSNNPGKGLANSILDIPMTYNYDDFIPANAEPFVISGTTLVACNKYTAFIAIPNGVKTIAKGAFSNKKILKELSLPISLQYIEKEAFLNCPKLSIIRASNNIVSISQAAFDKAELDDPITFGVFEETDDEYIVRKPKKLVTYPRHYLNLPTVSSKTESVTKNKRFLLTEGVSHNFRIKKPTFYQDEEIIIENGTLYFDKDFSNKTIEIPEGIEALAGSIPNSLERITFPKSFKTLGSNLFKGCHHLDSVYLEDSQVNVIPSNCFEASGIIVISFPKTLEGINSYAFASCIDLENIYIPSSVKFIAANAFSNCAFLDLVLVDDEAYKLELEKIAPKLLQFVDVELYQEV